MLENYDKNYNYKNFKIKDLGERLARLQRIATSMNIATLIIIDGFESSGRGYAIKKLTEKLNPKHMRVEVFNKRSEKEKIYMKKFWDAIPKYGDIKIFNRSYYFDLFNDLNIKKDELDKKLFAIENFEKALYDDHYIIMKFFIDVTEENQKERIDKYLDTDYTSFYVDKTDKNQNKSYQKYRNHIDEILENTNFEKINRNIVDGKNIKNATKEILAKSISKFEKGIERVAIKRENGIRNNRKYKEKSFILENLDLNKKISEDEYKKNLKPLQKKANELAMKFLNDNRNIYLVFEGVDAAGKDGSIERLVKKIDPRAYTVFAISAPDEQENSFNYLWRFYRDFTSQRKISIFSRSRYGRVMVERVEGFANDNEWERAYDEINNMEKEIVSSNDIVLKFFVAIDKKTQLKRFEERENDEDKQFKITSEDWRNREKRDLYISAMDEMLMRTNTKYAPRIVVEGNDKKYARIKVLKEFINFLNKKFN
ncbi:MAG: hypothetical protein SOZ89_02675 [Peptoniphilaceae bacterium]|nr:hypothetical protein [Peptoniphilaceae bacterium]MDD7383867.1 hypothetical protein [Peptoniphilaceae bacterium]MDY3738008.1 hypothetical protein [Peptoniphilaceae bacterium]